MDRRNLITVTLLLSALAFNPLLAREKESYSVSQLQRTSISEAIASRLHKKGLEEEVAVKVAQSMVKDDMRFTLMVENLLSQCEILDQDDVLEYLSKEALFRKKVALDDYGQLVNMASKLKHASLDETVLHKLHAVAKLNKALSV